MRVTPLPVHSWAEGVLRRENGDGGGEDHAHLLDVVGTREQDGGVPARLVRQRPSLEGGGVMVVAHWDSRTSPPTPPPPWEVGRRQRCENKVGGGLPMQPPRRVQLDKE